MNAVQMMFCIWTVNSWMYSSRWIWQCDHY